MTDFEEVISLLLRVIPEMGSAYHDYADEQRVLGRPSPAPEKVLREVLVPFMRALLAGPDPRKTSALLSRILTVVEHLSGGADPEVKCLIEVSFCGALIDDEGTRRNLVDLMGPNTLRLLEVARIDHEGRALATAVDCAMPGVDADP